MNTEVTARRSASLLAGPSNDVRQSLLDTYLLDLRQHPVLSRDEEHELAVDFSVTGDRRLANRLVTANLRLVVKVAFEYRTKGNNPLDLVQEGNLGLLHAVEKYDPHRGIRLSTYAVWWIRAYMLRFILASSRLVKVGTTQAQRRLFFGLRKERARLEGLGGPPPTTAQLAKSLGVREKDVTEMDLRLAAAETSLDAPRMDDEGDLRPYDKLAADEGSRPDVLWESAELQSALHAQLDAFSGSLAGRDAEIFQNRLLSEDALSLAELGVKLGVSRERVRQLEAHLKTRLRGHLKTSLGDALPS